MLLQPPMDLALPKATRHFMGRLNLGLSTDDGMYGGNDRHYLSCGASALNVMLSAVQLAGVDYPSSILDFGGGAGRVTRWLRAAFPAATIDVCDLREQDLSFCQHRFATKTWVSGTDIEALNAPSRYDLIWLGSVVTHLPAAKTLLMIDKILSWANAGGLVLMSFHGRYALERQSSGNFRYIDDESWTAITRDYRDTGYGYANYPGQDGYGISITKPSWIASAIEQRSDAKLITISETAWDDHHDVLVFQAT